MLTRILAITCCINGIFCFCLSSVNAQEKERIQWLTFEQLEDSLDVNPRPVFIDFYTEWCTYCRKMDKVVFTKDPVINVLNESYYSVRFDAESEDEVIFGGRTFINGQVGESRNPVHQIAQLLALRDGQFVPPTLVLLDTSFNVTARYFEYLDSQQLLKMLKP